MPSPAASGLNFRIAGCHPLAQTCLDLPSSDLSLAAPCRPQLQDTKCLAECCSSFGPLGPLGAPCRPKQQDTKCPAERCFFFGALGRLGAPRRRQLQDTKCLAECCSSFGAMGPLGAPCWPQLQDTLCLAECCRPCPRFGRYKRACSSLGHSIKLSTYHRI